jgi:hypothetical protein
MIDYYLRPCWKALKHGYALKRQAGLFFGRTEMHNDLVYPVAAAVC